MLVWELLHLFKERQISPGNEGKALSGSMPLNTAEALLNLEAPEERIEGRWPACNWTLTTSSGLPTHIPTAPLA